MWVISFPFPLAIWILIANQGKKRLRSNHGTENFGYHANFSRYFLLKQSDIFVGVISIITLHYMLLGKNSHSLLIVRRNQASVAVIGSRLASLDIICGHRHWTQSLDPN